MQLLLTWLLWSCTLVVSSGGDETVKDVVKAAAAAGVAVTLVNGYPSSCRYFV